MVRTAHSFDQPAKIDLRIYDNIHKVTIGQGHDYTTGCLLAYPYFKEHCKMIAIHLRNQQALDGDPKAIKQINFMENLDQDGNKTMFLIIEEAKKTHF